MAEHSENSTYKMPKAVRSHSCDLCGGDIPVGERYLYISTTKRSQPSGRIYQSETRHEHRTCPVAVQIPTLTDEQVTKWFISNPSLLPYKLPIPDAIRDRFESEIRSLASTVLTGLDNRKNHPTYGYTKAIIRDHYNRLAGAIGMYGILTEQYRVATLWQSTEFSSPVTTGTVRNALDRYDRMQDGVTE